MNAPKILVISSYTGSVNAMRPEAEMYIGLHRKGMDITIMTPGVTEYSKKFKAEGIPVIDFSPQKKIDFEAIHKIRETLITGKFNILHLYTNKAISNGNFAARGLPVKVLTYRGYTGNIYWWDPFCYLTHLNPRVDKIVCLSESVQEWMDRQITLPKHKTQLIHKGHDPAWFEGIVPADLKPFGVPENAIVFGCIANIRRMKGLKYLLQSTYFIDRELPVHFLLVGEKMDKPFFVNLIRNSPMKDRIHLTGWRKDAINLMAACDATVLASIKGEATPKAVIESMYLGVVPVVTTIPGTRGMVEEGKSGFTAPSKNPKALATAIEKVARLSPQKRKEMGARAKERVTKLFNIEDSIQNYYDFYYSLVEPRR